MKKMNEKFEHPKAYSKGKPPKLKPENPPNILLFC